jgi:GNAT superfamily N-acetyltransferase
VRITVVGPSDLAELQPLMRAYCDFYQVAPGDQALLELSQALLADPRREGLQLLARDDTGRAVGFATLFWTWQTLAAARVGVMNDLYVAAKARGTGVAGGLIAACLERCRKHGATQLIWQTAVDNHRARRPSMSGLGPPATTAGWTTSSRLILADRWRRRDARRC